METVLQLLQDYPPGHHHLASYNVWQRSGLHEVFEGRTFESASYTWTLGNLCVKSDLGEKAAEEALRTGGTLNCEIYIDVAERHKKTGATQTLSQLHLASVPVVIEDGYFVVNGLERVLISQIRNAYNHLSVQLADQAPRRNQPRTFSSSAARVVAQCSLRSMSAITFHSCTCEMSLWSTGHYTLVHGKLKGVLDVLMVLRALGLAELEDYVGCFGGQARLLAEQIFVSSHILPSVAEAQRHLARTLKFTQKMASQTLEAEAVPSLLVRELFPHLGPGATVAHVTAYIGHMLATLHHASQGGGVDVRDSLHFKRVEAAGVLVGDLMRQLGKKWLSALETSCRNRDYMTAGLVEVPLTKRLLYCFTTGVWGSQMTSYKRTGVSQPHATSSWLSRRSHIQRIASPVSRETRNQNIRQFHTSQMGYICPCETPEGHAIGVVLNLACTASLSVRFPTSLLLHFLKPHLAGMDSGRANSYLVLVNGAPVGRVADAQNFYAEFARMRRLGYFGAAKEWGKVSIGLCGLTIGIWADEGRPVRLVRTAHAAPQFSHWLQGLQVGALQWIDAYEEEYGFERMSPERELHPIAMLGMSAAAIPLLNYQPAPRSVYATSMIKQAVAAPYSQATSGCGQLTGLGLENPLVTTHLAPPTPYGHSAIVAICPYYGFNQEDGVVVSRAALQRGLFSSVSFRTYKVYEETSGETFKTIGLPQPSLRNPRNNYSMLSEDGLVKLNSRVVAGDVLVGATSFQRRYEEDASEVYSRSEPAIVYASFVCGVAPFRVATVTLAHDLTVCVGDKVASRHAQKHTIGYIAEMWELPFTEEGLVPDIIMNPLALPSRATPTVLEAAISLKVLNKGLSCPTYCDPFCDRPEELADGLQTMYNPVSSLCMEPIFVGPVYYMRLPHFAQSKCYARARGVVSRQTRQPTDGRSRHGGLRVGEMERDAILALRMPHVLEDRFFYNSDTFWVHVCRCCRNTAINACLCYCGNVEPAKIDRVKLSFASNLIFNQLRALGCSLKMFVGDDSPASRERADSYATSEDAVSSADDCELEDDASADTETFV